MPRAALTLLVALAASTALPVPSLAVDPHLDPRLLPGGCSSCHAGHGAPNSPMLPRSQREVCLDCHDSEARKNEQVRRGRLAPESNPPLLGSTLALPYPHPLTPDAYSRFELEAVVCSSCHSPHRRGVDQLGAASRGLPRISPRNPRQLEHELCLGCHGAPDPSSRTSSDLGRLLDSTSRSFHPVLAPAKERSSSVESELAQKRINCTDCHGSSRSDGPRGPHASEVPGLLGRNLVATDGSEEREATYALCYRCHQRPKILGTTSSFPAHRLHVVDARVACSTCHSAHGSIENRALIRFGEETRNASVAPSISTGRLGFDSEASGSGACYLTCHGVDHGPKTYGAATMIQDALKAAATSSPGPEPSSPGPETWDDRLDRLRPKPQDDDHQDRLRPPG